VHESKATGWGCPDPCRASTAATTFLFVTPPSAPPRGPRLIDIVRDGTLILTSRLETDQESLDRVKAWCEYGYWSYYESSNLSVSLNTDFAKMKCVSDQAGGAKQVLPQAMLEYRLLVIFGIIALCIGVGLVVLGKT